MRIGIDVDEVVADLHGPWIEWGNRRFGTDYTHFPYWDAPTDWWGKAAYDFLTPHIYDPDGPVLPVKGAQSAIKAVMEDGHKVVFISTCFSVAVARAKRLWCSRHFGGKHSFVSSDRKAEVQGIDLMVDDGIHNLLGFRSRGILIARPHNSAVSWHTTLDSIVQLPLHLRERCSSPTTIEVSRCGY